MLQGNISSFSSFYFGNATASVLPLQLMYFKGSFINNATLLQWQTENEHNTSHFIIERSTDGSRFDKIATVAAAINSNSKLNYSYVDNKAAALSAAIVYYRLQIVDLDGSITYSKVVTILFEPSSYTISIYPNPIHAVLKVKLSLTKADNLQIQVTDINGRAVYKRSKFVGTGISEVAIDTKGWSSQMYLVRVTDSANKILVAQSVVKQ